MDAEVLKDRILTAVQESIDVQKEAIVNGSYQNMEEYKHAVGVYETLVGVRDRVNYEYKKLYREILGDEDEQSD